MTAAMGVVTAADAPSERRPPRQDRAGAAAAVTVAAVEVGAVVAEAARRQVVAAGAEQHPLEKGAAPGTIRGPAPFSSLALWIR
jgi:hypothetical protein